MLYSIKSELHYYIGLMDYIKNPEWLITLSISINGLHSEFGLTAYIVRNFKWVNIKLIKDLWSKVIKFNYLD